MLSAQQQAQIQEQSGKPISQMSDDEINDAIETSGVDVPDEESYIDELERLGELKEKGLITDEEFEVKKKQLLRI